MKNIHITPTDQPSRLHYYENPLKEWFLSKESLHWRTSNHIYITSDEEIKEGDWMIRDNEQPTLITPNFFWDFGVKYHKIILTTDKYLVKDGVQAIDDVFLEWFVKNPTCEFVEVVKKLVELPLTYKMIYKIIIPQEEPKQETLEEKVMETQAIEEAAENYVEQITEVEFGKPHNAPHRVKSFIAGAKSDAAKNYWFEEFKKK
jgi:hypothetical protein